MDLLLVRVLPVPALKCALGGMDGPLREYIGYAPCLCTSIPALKCTLGGTDGLLRELIGSLLVRVLPLPALKCA